LDAVPCQTDRKVQVRESEPLRRRAVRGLLGTLPDALVAERAAVAVEHQERNAGEGVPVGVPAEDARLARRDARAVAVDARVALDSERTADR